MSRVRRVVNASVEVAAAKRICHHNRKDHSISKGEACLVVRDPSSGGKKNYCDICGLEILDRAADDLHVLREQLG